jgi:subfamily B ATP-binding cassette protein MsbA
MFGRPGAGARAKIARAGEGNAGHALSRRDIPVFRRLLAFVRPYTRRLALAALCLLGVSIASLVFPWVVRSLVDSVFLHHDERTLNLIALALFAVFVLQAILNFGQTYLISWVGERIVADLRRHIYDHLTSLSLSFYSESRTGELMSRVTNDVNAVQTAVSGNLLSLLQQVVTLFGSLAIIFYLDWRLSLLMLVVTPMLAFCGAFFGRWLGRIARQVQAALGEATTVLEETLGNMRVVQSFTREQYESQRFGGMVERVFVLTLGRIRVRASFVSLISFLAFGSITLVLWFGGREVLHGDLTPGGLISFLFYIFLIAGPLGTLANLYSQIRESMGAATRIFELLDTPPAITDRPGARSPATTEGRVTFVDVRFSYAVGHEVLRGVSFTMEPGAMVALVGPSGAGKTTIATLIPRFYDPDSGSVTVDGVDIRDLTLQSLRAQLAVVPQEPVLFGMSIRENIAYGRLGATDTEILAAAEAANAREFIDKLPNGIDSQVGERGVKLSGGQRQRIAIARAILRDPRILILDEATSSLDNESERLVQEALERLMVGRTTLVIAHRLTTVQRADRIVVIDDGAVVESGTHFELLAAEGLYHRLYTLAGRFENRLPDDVPSPTVTAPRDLQGQISVPSLG